MTRLNSDTPLRVLIDLRWMIPGEAGGLEDVAYCFLDRLLARNDSMRLTLIVPSELIDRFRGILPAHVALLSRDGPREDLVRATTWLGQRLGRRAIGEADASGFDVVYTLNGRLHTDLGNIPALVMVPDLQHMVLPGMFPALELAARTIASREVARRARRILAISGYVRQSVIDLLGVEPERVATSYLAVDPVFSVPVSPKLRDSVLASYGLLGQRYLYLPAQLWPHKNHATVLDAIRLLAADPREQPPLLVCSGSTATAHGAALMRYVASTDLARLVRFIGRCPREDVPVLYANAEALVFCSLHEGFGLPVIEAMRMGCPVIASTTTSVPEVAGGAALLVDPLDGAAIAAQVHRLRAEPALRQSLIAAGEGQARRFSWERHCTEIVDLLYDTAGRQPPGGRRVTASHSDLRRAIPATSAGARFRQGMYPGLRRRLISALRRRRRSSDGTLAI